GDALGQHPGHAARIPIGQHRRRAGEIVARVEAGALVRPDGAGRRRAVGAPLPADVEVGRELEVAIDQKLAVLVVGLPGDLQGALDQRPGRRQAELAVVDHEDERLADHAAGEGGQEIVDETRVGLGSVAHSATPKENGMTRFSGTASRMTFTWSSMRTVSRGGTCSGRTTALRTFSIRGSRASAFST